MSLKNKDLEITKLILAEEKYENETLDLIASENYASRDVREAMGSVLNNKYAEGYPHKRYYAGEVNVDKIEDLARTRALKMFGLSGDKWAVNVQPYSGSPANYAIYLGLLNNGDKIMGMRLDQGGHITHGLPISLGGRLFRIVSYGVDAKTEKFNYNEIEKIAIREKPKLIICGATAYSRIIDFKKFSKIAKKVNAYLLADISHIAGFVVSGVHPSPFPYADVVMTTTHKTLRGPRGAIIISKKEIADRIDRAVFPGLQGGPHISQIAAKAVCFREAMQPNFKKYAHQIVANAQALSMALTKLGFRIVSGGTDNHLLLVDLRSIKMTGKEAQSKLEEVGIICNKNTIPNDSQKPFIGSGIRLGTPALTTRGMRDMEMKIIAGLISDTLKNKNQVQIKKEILELCRKYPIKV